MKIACLLADGFEDIEAIGTTAILRRSGMSVDYISVLNQDVQTGSFGTKVLTDKMIKDLNVDDYDALFIPGGRQASYLRSDKTVLTIVKSFKELDKWLFAICAGPTVLGILGYLDGIKYTSFPTTEEFMPKGIKLAQAAVWSNKIVTGAGAGAVTEFALKIIEAVYGIEKANQIQERILFRVFE
jgi:DJ-1 family protein